MKYTVLLLYPDYMSDSFGQETYLAWVNADDATQAVEQARISARRDNDATDYPAEDFFPLLVVEGHLADCREEPPVLDFSNGELVEGSCPWCGVAWEAHDEDGSCPDDETIEALENL